MCPQFLGGSLKQRCELLVVPKTGLTDFVQNFVSVSKSSKFGSNLREQFDDFWASKKKVFYETIIQEVLIRSFGVDVRILLFLVLKELEIVLIFRRKMNTS